jgi:hypothetical protein
LKKTGKSGIFFFLPVKNCWTRREKGGTIIKQSAFAVAILLLHVKVVITHAKKHIKRPNPTRNFGYH